MSRLLRARPEVLNAAESLVVARKLLQTGLHSVAYLRGLCDASHFEDVNSGAGLTLKRLKRDVTTEPFFEWEEGVFNALDAGYLKVMSLVVLSSDEAKVLERYDFEVEYLNGMPKMAQMGVSGAGLPTRREVTADRKNLITTLQFLTQSMQELPRARVVTVRVKYTPQTPKTYLAPCFVEGSERCVKQFRAAPTSSDEQVDLGKIRTLSYNINVSCRVPSDGLSQRPGNTGASAARCIEIDRVQPDIALKEEPASDSQNGADDMTRVVAGLKLKGGVSTEERDALKAALYCVGCAPRPVAFDEVEERFGFNAHTIARIGAQLADWGLLSTNTFASAQATFLLDPNDASVKTIVEALLTSPLCAAFSPAEQSAARDALTETQRSSSKRSYDEMKGEGEGEVKVEVKEEKQDEDEEEEGEEESAGATQPSQRRWRVGVIESPLVMQ